MAISDEENIKRTKNLTKADSAYACYQLAGCYQHGNGVPQDLAKANEFYLKAGELGCAEAYPRSYYDGRAVEVDKKKAKYYYELAAINGDIKARHNLGCMEGTAGNYHLAFKHLILAAKAGDKDSLDKVKEGFTEGFVTKEEYANSLRAHQQQHDEMKSNDRDKVRALINDGVMGRLVM